MLLNFNAEERALLASVDAVVDIPRNTKPAVARKLYDNLKRLVNQLRGLAPTLEARGLMPRQKKMAAAEVRNFVASQYPAGASFEEVARWRKAGYSIDTINALHLADITIRGLAMRADSGAAADPELKFRDKDGIHPEVARTTAEHQESAKYHTARAGKAHSLAEAESQYHCSDRHVYAAAYPNDVLASDRARQASRIAKG